MSAAVALAGLAALGCVAPPPAPPQPASGLASYLAANPSADERYCAWYGSRGADDVLYFGQAAFWSAMRGAGGDPTADLSRVGPQLVGRFDLAAERLLPPLSVGGPDSRSGVWDVHAGADGRVYFTTFFESAGAVDPASGAVSRFPELGSALNELAAGSADTLLATRYSGAPDGGDGAVIEFDRSGRLVRSWPLAAPGYRVAAKTPLWDELRRELWVTADLLPAPGDPGARERHDAFAVGADGRVRRIAEPPELMFIAAGADGTVYRAELDGSELSLRVAPPPGRGAAHRIALDAAFSAGIDFAQDIQLSDDGRVVVTRWSGIVHVVQPDGSARSVQLPRLDPDGLYYTGVVRGERLCATYCADVAVVCVDAP